MEYAPDIISKSIDLNKEDVVVQSMTNTKTSDIDATGRQIKDLYRAGCNLIRVSTPTLKDVDFLSEIMEDFSFAGTELSFIADVHYDIDVAIAAAKIADKVRINPGNFLTREEMNWPDSARIKILGTKLNPFIATCKEFNTKVRIGVNHGSIYKGQRPKKNAKELVESLLEYVDIFIESDFSDLVLSIKSSDPWMMMNANFLLKEALKRKGLALPVHLGVTEAGLGMEGIVKSALGIGSCLMAGIGRTIRVSLTEDPVKEIPVANAILKAAQRADKRIIDMLFDQKEHTSGLNNHFQSPIVVNRQTSFFEVEGSKNWLGDYVLKKDQTEITGLEHICAFEDYRRRYSGRSENSDPSYLLVREEELYEALKFLSEEKIDLPILVKSHFKEENPANICSASMILPHLIKKGIIQGLWLESGSFEEMEFQSEVAGEILQVSGRREIKTSIISCPGCSRTNFHLQSLTQELKDSFSEEKITISVMGCSVNGYGEMMKSDFGIIGSGYGKVDVYKKQHLIKAAVPEEDLLELIDNNIKMES